MLRAASGPEKSRCGHAVCPGSVRSGCLVAANRPLLPLRGPGVARHRTPRRLMGGKRRRRRERGRPAHRRLLRRVLRSRLRPGGHPASPRHRLDALLVPARGEPGEAARRLSERELDAVPARIQLHDRVPDGLRRRRRCLRPGHPELLPPPAAVRESAFRRRGHRRHPRTRPGGAPVRDRAGDPRLLLRTNPGSRRTLRSCRSCATCGMRSTGRSSPSRSGRR